MPYKRKYGYRKKPSYSRYGYKSKYKYGKRKARYSRYPQIAKYGSYGLPKAIFTKLTYSEHVLVNSSTTTPGYYVYRLNSTFDPNQTGTGGQPYMRDTYAALYSYYVVSGAKVKVQASTDGTYDILLTQRQTPNLYTVGDIDLEIERGAIKRTITNDKPSYISTYYSVSKGLGISKRKLFSDDQYSSGVAANPSIPLYVQFAAIASDRSTTIGIDLQVEITYYVKFYSPIDQSAS